MQSQEKKVCIKFRCTSWNGIYVYSGFWWLTQINMKSSSISPKVFKCWELGGMGYFCLVGFWVFFSCISISSFSKQTLCITQIFLAACLVSSASAGKLGSHTCWRAVGWCVVAWYFWIFLGSHKSAALAAGFSEQHTKTTS